jgi:signal peptidase II
MKSRKGLANWRAFARERGSHVQPSRRLLYIYVGHNRKALMAPHSPRKETTSRRGFWLLVCLVAVASLTLDVASKHWAQHTLQRHPQKRVVVAKGWLALTYARNSAGAWGMLRSLDRDFRHLVLSSVSAVSLLVLAFLIYSCPRERRLVAAALAAVMGGALGNLADRLRWGYVVDFVDWHKGVRWPIFNVADVAITAGVVVLAVLVVTDGWVADDDHRAIDSPQPVAASKKPRTR